MKVRIGCAVRRVWRRPLVFAADVPLVFEPPHATWYPRRTLRRHVFLSFPLSLVALATLLVPSSAHADVTSWLALGTGYEFQHNHGTGANDRGLALGYSLGVGSSPQSSFVLGGILRGTTFFGLGTDLGIALRGATGGFARGQWGAALDLGVVGRWWREFDYGQYPIRVVATGGAPWGLQLAVGADLGSVAGGTPARGFFGLVEIDLLRLTVMRQGATDAYWKNPFPAGRSQ